MTDQALGVHSETGNLRQVDVCRPGLAHRRLPPANCQDLLFDDVFWVKQAQKDHDVFASTMRKFMSKAMIPQNAMRYNDN